MMVAECPSTIECGTYTGQLASLEIVGMCGLGSALVAYGTLFSLYKRARWIDPWFRALIAAVTPLVALAFTVWSGLDFLSVDALKFVIDADPLLAKDLARIVGVGAVAGFFGAFAPMFRYNFR